jgi:hypothetical protein
MNRNNFGTHVRRLVGDVAVAALIGAGGAALGLRQAP